MKNKKLLIGIAIAFAIVVIGIIAISTNSKVTVDLSKLYDVTFEGLNGEGIAALEFNKQEKDAIISIIEEKVSDIDDISTFFAYEYRISPSEDLKNGDEVTVTAVYSETFFERYGLEAKNAEQTFIVSGLVDPEVIDPFEGLEIEFTGKSPFITCTLITGGCSDFVRENVEFEIESEYYAHGESVSVIASCSETALKDAKIKLETTQTEFIAESTEAYIDNVEGVDLTTVQLAMQEQLQLEYSAADEELFGIDLGWTNHYTGLINETYMGSAFLVLQDKEAFVDDDDPYNIYIMYYRSTIGVEHQSKGNESTFETDMDVLLIATNLYIDEAGTLHFDRLIQVEGAEVDNASNLKSAFIKKQQKVYAVLNTSSAS